MISYRKKDSKVVCDNLLAMKKENYVHRSTEDMIIMFNKDKINITQLVKAYLNVKHR